MKIIGLTGNIGSGKSMVAQIFRVLGVSVYYADLESKLILDQEVVIDELCYLFGDQIRNPDGKISRPYLAKLVFGNESALQKLNNVLHPRVKDHFNKWVANQSGKYIIQEAAIIFESGFASGFDKIICVSCPEETAIQRVIIRDGINREEVIRRMQHQIPDEKKSAMADFVIINDGQRLVIPQTLSVHEKLLQISS